MTTDEFLKALAVRGLVPAWTSDGPVLRGNKGMVTYKLLKVLAHHKDEIVRRLMADRQREFLTPVGGIVRSGPRVGRTPLESWPDDYEPSGALWWRFVGESEWQLTSEGVAGGWSVDDRPRLPPLLFGGADACRAVRSG